MLLSLLIIPLIGILIPNLGYRNILILSLYNLLQTHYIIYLFDKNSSEIYQYSELNIIGIDGISLWLIWLVNMLMPIMILNQWKTTYKIKSKNGDELFFIQLIGLLSILVFIVKDILLFYISFESVLIPMFFFISNHGTKNRKLYATYSFILYTLTGSLYLLIGIVWIYITNGTTNLEVISPYGDELINSFIWFSFFIAFIIKLPLIPFHSWLIITHTESPTIGSVILAAILLKMGNYGLIRFNLPIFPIQTIYFKPFIYILCILSIIYSSISAYTQIDIKLIIAYSSIGHQATSTLGLFSNDIIGIQGSIYYMISHGLISSGLFILIGMIYNRYGTRTIYYYRGLIQIYPIYIVILWCLTMANSAVPGTSGFIGEYMSLYGIFTQNIWIGIWSSLSIILVPIFMLKMLHMISYGEFTPYFIWITNDLTKKEINILIPLIFYLFLFGIFPNIILDMTLWSSLNILIE